MILVRHGESVANAQGLLLGRTDAALTDVGREQAAAVRTLLHAPVAELRSSPLRRARDTADLLGLGLPVGIHLHDTRGLGIANAAAKIISGQRPAHPALQYGAAADCESRKAPACRVNDSWNWKREPCPESG